VTQTFAKAWGLSGLRIGYAAACPDVIRLLHKVRPMYEVNTVAVVTMEKMLDHRDEMMASVKRLNAGKTAFLDAMQGFGLKVLRSHGNFFHVAFGPYASAVHEQLKSKVLYRLDFKEPCLKGFSRFSATTVERFDPIIECIRQIINKKQM